MSYALVDESGALMLTRRISSEGNKDTTSGVDDSKKTKTADASPSIVLAVSDEDSDDAALAKSKSQDERYNWAINLTKEFEKISHTVIPRSEKFSPHQRWQAFITFLRQPGNRFSDYDEFRKCQCCPYTGKCPRPLPVQIRRLFATLNLFDETRHEGVPQQILSKEASDVVATCQEMADTVFFYYQRLRRFVAEHESRMQTKWLHKSKRQRQTILRLAAELDTGGIWANSTLPKTHRPERESTFANCALVPPNPMKLPTYAVPHINLEDLSTGNNLLMFLKARGRDLPGAFARHDLLNCGMVTRQMLNKRLAQFFLEASATSSCANCPKPIFDEIPGLFLTVEHKSTPEAYGTVHSWEEVRKNNQKWFLTDEGQYVLLIQKFIYSFLDRVCVSLLHDIDGTLFDSLWVPAEQLFTKGSSMDLPEPELPQCADPKSPFPSIRTMLQKAIYGVPSRLNLPQLESLISARAAKARDHLWELRCDPGYFKEALLVESAHSPLHLPGPNGACSPDVANGRGSEYFWACAIENVLRAGHVEVVLWTMFLQRIQAVQVAYEECVQSYASGDHGTSKLPGSRLHQLLCELNGFVVLAEDYTSKEMFLTSLSCFRHVWKIHEHIGLCEDLPIDFSQKSPPWRLAWMFHVLGQDQLRRRHETEFVLADCIQGILDDDEAESKPVTPHLRSRFNDWAIVQEVDRQISNFTPFSRTIQRDTFEKSESILVDLAILNRFNRCAFGAAQVLTEDDFLRGNRFNYPDNKPRTEQNVFVMQASERDLADFWQRFDGFCAKHFEPVEKMLKIRFLDQTVPLRTEAWESPADIEPMVNDHVNYAASLREMEMRTSETLAAEGAKAAPRVKVKTRGITTPSTEAVPVQALRNETEGQVPMPTIVLGKKAYKTLTSLFFSPEQQLHQVREIAWTEFLYAMVAAGFNVQKLWGSIWHFSPQDRSLGRSIQFHDPHPSMKLDVAKARRIGRRLNRAYGWTVNSFTRKEVIGKGED